jgi:hypothetical protein
MRIEIGSIRVETLPGLIHLKLGCREWQLERWTALGDFKGWQWAQEALGDRWASRLYWVGPFLISTHYGVTAPQ